MKADPGEWKALLAERLADALSDKGLKQNDLAARLGVSEAAVSRWVSDKGGVGWKRLAEICSAIGVPSDQLLGLKPASGVSRNPGGSGKAATLAEPEEFIKIRLRCPHCDNVIEKTKIERPATGVRRRRRPP